MELLPPISSKDFFSRFSTSFQKLNYGLSLKVFGLAGCGKTAIFNWIVRNSSTQSLLNLSSDTKLHYLDLSSSSEPEIQKQITTQLKNYLKTFDIRKYKLILVIDSAISLVGNKPLQLLLSQFYHANRPNLSFIYLFGSYYKLSYLIKHISFLKTSLSEESYYFSFFNKDETDFCINQWQTRLQIPLSSQARKFIHLHSGGYPSLIKHFCLCSQTFPLKEKSPEITQILSILYHSLTQKQKFIVKSIFQQKPVDRQSLSFKQLIKFGLIRSDLSFFSPLFQIFVADKIRFQAKAFGLSFQSDLTSSEYNFLKLLSDNKGIIISRDQVAQAIWKNLWQEKYSDWAIDKMVSQLRRKMSTKESVSQLEVIRNRGFRLSL